VSKLRLTHLPIASPKNLAPASPILLSLFAEKWVNLVVLLFNSGGIESIRKITLDQDQVS
jgi:hypothetical protein